MKTRLRVLRAEIGWSQAELARMWVYRTLHQLHRKEPIDPSLPLASKIVRVFGKEEVFLPQDGAFASLSSSSS